MNTKIIERSGAKIAVINSDEMVISDTQSALDLIATVRFEHDIGHIVINKSAVTEDLFRLSTGVAGEILQKFANYRCAIAIVGDYSQYTSGPLRDFIYESNNGGHVFFVADEECAIAKLAGE